MVTAMKPATGALITWAATAMACGSDALDPAPGDAAGDSASDAIAWHTPIAGLAGALLSVWGPGPDEIWAVGVDAGDGTGPIVIRGAADDGWRRLDVRGADRDGGHLWWVFGPDRSATWIVGERGRVLRVEGDAVERVESGTDATLYGVWGASQDVLWAVGGYVPPRSGPPTIVRLTREGGEVVALPEGLEASGTFFKVWGARADDVWVVGEKGMALHFDGAAWRRVALAGAPRLVTVHGSGAGHLAAVGGTSHGVIYQGVGQDLAAVTIDGVAPLNGVFVEPGGGAWAVGMLGEVLRRAGHEAAWETVRGEIVRRDWHAVWVDARGDVWLAGGNLLSRLDQGTLVRRGPTRRDLPSGEVRGLDPTSVEADGAETVEPGEPDASDGGETVDDGAEEKDGEDDGEIESDSGPSDADTTSDGDADTTSDGDADATSDGDADATSDGDAVVVHDFELGALDDGGDFVPLADGSTIAMEHGPQGGFHLVVAARFAWPSNDPEVPIGLSMRLEVDDAVVAATYPVTAYPAQRVAEGVYQTYGLLVMFCEDPPPGDCYVPSADSGRFDGRRARLSAEVSPPGVTWRRALEIVLRDTR